MDKEEFNLMEVKPKSAGMYFVTLYQFKHPTHYTQVYLEYNGDSWLYHKYDSSYVCFIHEKVMNS